MAGKENAGKSEQTLKLIEDANRRGNIRVRADQYPFLAGQTALVSALPKRFATEGIAAMVERLKDRGFRQEVEAEIFSGGSQSLLRFQRLRGLPHLGCAQDA